MSEDINYLQQKAREWAGQVVNLYNTKVPPEYEAEKRALISTAKGIKDAVEYVTGPLSVLAPMDELGFFPVVIGAVGVAGAVALIVKWTLDYQTFVKKIQDRNALIAGGMTPQQAANISNMSEKQGGSLINFDGKKLGLLALLGVGGYLVGKKQGWF